MAVKRRKAEFVRRFAEAEGATPLGRHTAYFGGQDLGIPDGTDGQLAQVLPPGLMQKVREKVMRDSTLDQTIAADLEMVSKDHVNQTPGLVIESKGKRENIGTPPSFAVLKSYLDQLLRQ